jgi:oligopeptide/dipeptide ABC transporter ATP-binding protein
MLFISHDLETIHALCDRVVVLYLGCEVETGSVDAVFNKPAHPYTQALLSAQLFADPAVKTVRQHLQGEIPSPLAAPPGCPFSTRCPVYEARCDAGLPPMHLDREGVHAARCIRLAPDRFPSLTETN